ncbi:hypothetical protein RRX38_07220 [Pseudomonas sp. DTU_2021_1001937_2_SI_NGA_ILE_001]|uniref:hypothetical protein n=1 Tax=Pseudomonas sp. DTU_2021_1001937_2_SI_NGA_ILE_001 TaxID=3077589 RepID=UPI0028FC17CE|nr:hypothetical protein [Pseudomonas sp. DTU_2021_1001937_2_SI_NGA_ILE_001]WNW10953.1 hypothetical protein RRX38_07220 [Pseudomonas sp. DTU_2021_1001937_2_SI_NGA_ILE_001]
MKNTTELYHAHRPQADQNEEYDPPLVPIADPEDGLIRTVDLQNDIVVNFPLWNLPQLNDEYWLILNGEAVGEPSVLNPIPPNGTQMELTIPVATHLLEDGIYSLQYQTSSNPGSNDTVSKPTYLIVDRTAPGSHQLGYMDFPDEAKDGLTLEELSAMGDVLPGRIFGYSGLNRGDVINTYWGGVAGPTLTLNGDEDEDTPLEVGFTKDFLTSLPNPAGATYYTVTDRAGNVSVESRRVTIPLFLTEITPDLPAPVIEGDDGLIDYADAAAGVEVKIPTSTLLEAGDQIQLYWGNQKLGPAAIDPDDLGMPFVLIFDVALPVIEAAGDGLRVLKYEVLRSGQVVGVSTELPTQVLIERPVPQTPAKPTVRGGSGTPSNEDNFIDENDFELNATVIIDWNPNFKASQVIEVYWGGQAVLQQPYTITNSDVVAGRPLLLTALNSLFVPVGTGSDIRVYYSVSMAGNPNISISEEQSIVVRSKDELPGGPDGPIAPLFTDLNENGAINVTNGAHGAPVYIEPYINIAEGQVIVFTYEAYDSLVGGTKKFEWVHTSAALTQAEVDGGYHFLVPRTILNQHCYGHAEATFAVRSAQGQGNSRRASVLVDMRVAGSCGI